MLGALLRRAARAGLADRIETRLAPHGNLGVDDLQERVDFLPAIFMVHEIPDAGAFFAEAYRALRPGGRMLVAEPRMHVPAKDFEALMQTATRAGFVREGPVRFPGGRAAMMSKRPHVEAVSA